MLDFISALPRGLSIDVFEYSNSKPMIARDKPIATPVAVRSDRD